MSFLDDFGDWLGDLKWMDDFGGADEVLRTGGESREESLSRVAENGAGPFVQAAHEAGKAIGLAINLASQTSVVADAVARDKVPGFAPAMDYKDHMLELYDTIWDEGINQPISTAITAGRLTDQEQVNKGDAAAWKYFFSGDTWEKAYGIADTTSIGQATTELASAGPFNPEREEFADYTQRDIQRLREKSAVYNITSGTIDFAANFFLDPGVVVGKAAMVARRQIQKRPIKPGEDIEAAMAAEPKWFEKAGPLKTRHLNQRTESVIKAVQKRPEANYLLHAVDGLKQSTNGPALAAALAKSGRKGDPEETKLVLRLAYGDNSAIAALGKRDSEIADLLVKANDQTDHLLNSAKWMEVRPGTFRYFDQPQVVGEYKTRLNNIEEAQKKIRAERERLDYYKEHVLDTASGQTLRATKRSEQKAFWKLGETVIQPTLWNLPVRVFSGFGKTMPPGVIELDDPASVNQLGDLFKTTPNLPASTRNRLLNRYMETSSPGVKYSLVQEAKEAVITAKAKQYGIAPDDARKVVASFMSEDARAAKMFGFAGTERYAGNVNPATGELADVINVAEDGTAVVPLLAPQLANAVALPNLQIIDRALRRNAGPMTAMSRWLGDVHSTVGMRAKGPKARAAELKAWGFADASADGLNVMNKVWKAAVLVGRPVSYMLRVLGDNEMRVHAKLGAAAHGLMMERRWHAIKAAGRGLGKNAYDARAMYKADSFLAKSLREDIEYAEALKKSDDIEAGDINAMKAELEEAEGRVKAADELGKVKAYQPQQGKRLGEGTLEHEGIQLDDAFGGPDAEMRRNLASNGGLLDRILVQYEDKHYARNAKAASSYVRIEPTQKGHQEAWLQAINHQIRNDPMAQRILAGTSEKDVLKWLKHTPEGREHIRQIGVLHASNLERWVSNVRSMVDEYIPAPEWREALQTRDLRAGELKEFIDRGAPLPTVHGAMLDYNLGKGAFARAAKGTYETLMRVFSTLPEEKLARHPLYVAMYRQRARDFIDQTLADPKRAELGKAADALDADEYKHMYKVSHDHALKGLKDTLWDISAYSTSAHALRFVSPFIHAWQETLSRWWNLEKDKPQLLAYFGMAWQAPNSIGLVVDQDGNSIDESKGLNDDEMVVLKLPAWMGSHKFNIPGSDMVPHIFKSSFNITLQGDPWWLPGTGPVIQAPLSYWANEMPEFEDTMIKFGLLGPGGAAPSVGDAVIPAYAKRWRSWLDEGRTQRDFATTHGNIYKEMYIDWEKAGSPGKWNEDKKFAEAKQKTKDLFALRGILSHISPVSVQFKSKYQFYIDQYRSLKDEAAKSPNDERTMQWVDETFYRKHPEYFELVQSSGKANVDVPPTVSGVNAAKKYADLISAYPEQAAGIIAQEGEGEFSHAAYQYQTQKQYQTGNSETMRSHKNPREAVAAAEAKKGWLEYTKMNHLLNSVAQRRGLKSYREDRQLSILHTVGIQQLSGRNPSWEKDFSQRDANWFGRELPGIEKIANDPRLAHRSDIKTLRKYVRMRTAITKALANRKLAGGSDSPSANSNQDLTELFSNGVNQLAESSTYFDEHWYMRTLQADPLLIDLTEVTP